MPRANARVAHLLLVHRMTAVEVGNEFMEEPSSDDYDEVVFTQNGKDCGSFLLPCSAGESREGPHQ